MQSRFRFSSGFAQIVRAVCIDEDSYKESGL